MTVRNQPETSQKLKFMNVRAYRHRSADKRTHSLFSTFARCSHASWQSFNYYNVVYCPVRLFSTCCCSFRVSFRFVCGFRLFGSFSFVVCLIRFVSCVSFVRSCWLGVRIMFRYSFFSLFPRLSCLLLLVVVRVLLSTFVSLLNGTNTQ